jgi:hypothetical protein
MRIEKRYLKNILFIRIYGIIDDKSLLLLDRELNIIINCIGIIKISIDINNAIIKCDINSLFKRLHYKLLIRGGKLFLTSDKRINYNYLILANEYKVFELSNFI